MTQLTFSFKETFSPNLHLENLPFRKQLPPKLSLEEKTFFEEMQTIGKQIPVKYRQRPIAIQMRLLSTDVLSGEYTKINQAKDLMKNYLIKIGLSHKYTLSD